MSDEQLERILKQLRVIELMLLTVAIAVCLVGVSVVLK